MVKRGLIFLDRLYWLWLALAAPFLLFPSPKRSLVMLVVPGLFLLHWLALRVEPKTTSNQEPKTPHRQRSGVPSTPLNGAILLLVLMVLVSLWATFDIAFSLPKISGIVLGVGVFFSIVRAGQRLGGWFLSLLVLLGTGVGIGILGLLGTNWTDQKLTFLNPILARLPPLFRGWHGAESGFHPNEVAGVLIWVLPVMMAMSVVLIASFSNKKVRNNSFITPQNGHGRNIKNPQVNSMRNDITLRKTQVWRGIGAILFLLATTLISGVLVLTQSRSGFIGLTLVLPVICLFAVPARWRGYYLGLLVVLVTILGLLIYSQRTAISAWITGGDLAAVPALSLNTLQGRLEIWSRAIDAIQDFPLTGMGLNSFRKVVTVLYPFFMIPLDLDIAHAHNEFLQAALDLGLPGLIAFIGLYLIAFRMLREAWVTNRESDYFDQILTLFGLKRSSIIRAAILGLGGGLAAHMIYGFTDAVSLGAKPGLLFWMMLALICGLHSQTHTHKENPVDVSQPESQ